MLKTTPQQKLFFVQKNHTAAVFSIDFYKIWWKV